MREEQKQLQQEYGENQITGDHSRKKRIEDYLTGLHSQPFLAEVAPEFTLGKPEGVVAALVGVWCVRRLYPSLSVRFGSSHHVRPTTMASAIRSYPTADPSPNRVPEHAA
jgi:hypothetical protein